MAGQSSREVWTERLAEEGVEHSSPLRYSSIAALTHSSLGASGYSAAEMELH